MYNSLVERCFKDCVDSFRRKDMEPAEEKVKTFRFFRDFLIIFLLSRLLPAPHDEMIRKRNLTQKKKQCVTNCCEKYMKHSARTGVRFAELSSQAEQQIAQAMKK